MGNGGIMLSSVIEMFSDNGYSLGFKINIKEQIPKRAIGYAIKKEIFPSFTTKKMIEILTQKA